jgi:hypothetical protein
MGVHEYGALHCHEGSSQPCRSRSSATCAPVPTSSRPTRDTGGANSTPPSSASTGAVPLSEGASATDVASSGAAEAHDAGSTDANHTVPNTPGHEPDDCTQPMKTCSSSSTLRSCVSPGATTPSAANGADVGCRPYPHLSAPSNTYTFPNMPGSVPLTYTLLMKACLSRSPAHRPSFAQTLTILKDLCSEVACGSYINSDGWLQVCTLCWRFHMHGGTE